MSFKQHLIETLLRHINNAYQDNFAPECGEENGENCAHFYGQRIQASDFNCFDITAEVLEKIIEIVDANGHFYGVPYEWMQDVASKETIVQLCAYRLLGYKKVKLLRDSESYWNSHKLLSTLIEKRASESDEALAVFNLQGVGFDLRLASVLDVVHRIFVLKQYEYEYDAGVIRAEPNETVIDAGASFGESSLYFADRVGPNGFVCAFDLNESNIAVFKRNVEWNEIYTKRMALISKALHSVSNQTVDYNDDSLAPTPLTRNAEPTQAVTITIDDLVAEASLRRVDFIKLDIEKSELAALKGAYHTLKTHKPKLAISAHNKLEDLFEMTAFLTSLNLGYRFYLKHSSLHLAETVLFAH